MCSCRPRTPAGLSAFLNLENARERMRERFFSNSTEKDFVVDKTKVNESQLAQARRSCEELRSFEKKRSRWIRSFQMTGTETHYAHERLPSWPRGRLQNSLLGCTAGCLLSERGLRARRLFSGEWSCEQCLVRNRRHSPSVENGRILSLTIQHATPVISPARRSA